MSLAEAHLNWKTRPHVEVPALAKIVNRLAEFSPADLKLMEWDVNNFDLESNQRQADVLGETTANGFYNNLLRELEEDIKKLPELRERSKHTIISLLSRYKKLDPDWRAYVRGVSGLDEIAEDKFFVTLGALSVKKKMEDERNAVIDNLLAALRQVESQGF